jgi:hypothetical protein
MSLVLPTSKIPAVSVNPKFLIIYGRPKAGKTSCLAQLESNLIVDLEGGSQFIDAMAVQARTVNELGEIAQAIRAKNKEVGHNFYKHITIDNATRLEEICLSYAKLLYMQTPMGKNYKGDDVRTLPNGSGYMFIRQAVRKVIDMFKDLCDEFILVGHVKDVQIEQNGEELSEMALDLVGKLSAIVCGEADAVGYLYRKGNETHISFKGGDGTIKEARAPHLRGQDIIIATGNEDGTITTYWDKIYKGE